MIGIVLVSHSPALAHAALDLAREMVPGDEPRVAIAAGTAAGGVGTDALAVAGAITELASADGVLVMMDLGSAVLSAEMALDFVEAAGVDVILSPAPFVEGLTAALVCAAGGASLAEANREARRALTAKELHLDSGPWHEPKKVMPPDIPPAGMSASPAEARFVLTNEQGLHARPAALLVAALSGLDADVRVRSATRGPVDGGSLIGLMSLGARSGEEMIVVADGPQSMEAIAAIRAIANRNYGD